MLTFSLDCLQQATADQAFTNAKEAGDVEGQVAALLYRALERNTGQVGLASVLCESLEAVNPEIAAITQHQDPAGDGAIELNKQIAIELVKQIIAVGGDPLDANKAATFAPGEIGDPTAAGNTCNDIEDLAGCIETLNLRVDDLSAEEIEQIVAGEDVAVDADAAGNATVVAGEAAANATLKACNATNPAGAKKNKAKKNKNNNKNNAKAKAKAKVVKLVDNANKNKANDKVDAAKLAIAKLLASNRNSLITKTKARRQRIARQSADFGSCTDPTIAFGAPSDGRQEDAFEANDLQNFPHGSALNIKVIAEFICNQLTNRCEADDEAVAICDQAAAASTALKGQAAADAFNAALGF